MASTQAAWPRSIGPPDGAGYARRGGSCELRVCRRHGLGRACLVRRFAAAGGAGRRGLLWHARAAERNFAPDDFAIRAGDACRSRLRVLDINLRPPYWNPSGRARIVAVGQRAEAERCRAADCGRRAATCAATTTHCSSRLVKRFSLKLVALTRGAAGAVLLSASGERSDLPAPATVVVDTVGAGDSFTAALVIGAAGRSAAVDDQRLGQPRGGVRRFSIGRDASFAGRVASAAGLSGSAVGTWCSRAIR